MPKFVAELQRSSLQQQTEIVQLFSLVLTLQGLKGQSSLVEHCRTTPCTRGDKKNSLKNKLSAQITYFFFDGRSLCQAGAINNVTFP